MVLLQLADCVSENFTAFFCIAFVKVSEHLGSFTKSANGEKEANVGWDLSCEQNLEQKRFDQCFRRTHHMGSRRICIILCVYE